ncbi:LuxR C-terminal-related transcriptional regulator [Lysinibacillus sp. 38-6]|uniref:LuxR C-terminal-related transcriptional regulator n=1 Tax=Lysinibacillus sp. 38-6 TaxID=3385991 RepID=UPI003908A119
MTKINFQYVLFHKIHHQDIAYAWNQHVQTKKELSEQEIIQIGYWYRSWLTFLNGQLKHKTIQREELINWATMHSRLLPEKLLTIFPSMSYAATKDVLGQIKHPYTDDMLQYHDKILDVLRLVNSKVIQTPIKVELTLESLLKLQRFSKLLIQLDGVDHMPTILSKAQENFGYQRVIFHSYNPWLHEFSNVYGSELHKVQILKGKLEEVPVFAIKKPLYLEQPAPYINPIAIDILNLSTIIFIPIQQNGQLFGWLTFDQCGMPFSYSEEEMHLLEEAGNLLGCYFSRTRSTQRLLHDLKLTDKDLAVLFLLAEGFSNKEMAELLVVSEYTIRDYIQKLLTVFNAKNRTQIIATAFRMAVLE